MTTNREGFDADYAEYSARIWPYQPIRSTYRKTERQLPRLAELTHYPDRPRAFPIPSLVDPWEYERERRDTLRRLFTAARHAGNR